MFLYLSCWGFFMSDDMVEVDIPSELVNGVVVRIVEDFIS